MSESDDIELPEYRMPFIPLYLLMVELEDGEVNLVKSAEKKGPVVAVESNQYLLREIGDRLLEKKLIIGYQLVKTLTYPTRADSLLPT